MELVANVSCEIRREGVLHAVRAAVASCSQPIRIVGSQHTGKTVFAKQLSSEAECVGSWFCSGNPISRESATMLRAVARHLEARFPNLALPNFDTVTLLLGNCVDALLTQSLAALPQPVKPLFYVIDNITHDVEPVVLELIACFPSWLRLIVTSRLPSNLFHTIELSQWNSDLRRYAELYLPQLNPDDVFHNCQDSWFYLSLLKRATDRGILPPDTIPQSTRDLMDDVLAVLPVRLPIYLLLIKSARMAPSMCDLLAVSQVTISDTRDVIEHELVQLQILMEQIDPIILDDCWADIVDGDLSTYHEAWAERLKMKRPRKLHDIVELAYHLAHAGTAPDVAISTLESVGAAEMVLKCPVLDTPTTALLASAGVQVMDPLQQGDFVFSCAMGDEGALENLPNISDHNLALGLLAAAARNHVHSCKAIVKFRPQVSQTIGIRALRTAAGSGHLLVVDFLLRSGVPVDGCTCDGRTALRAASWAGYESVVERLVTSSAIVDLRDTEGRTPLMAAAFMDNADVVRRLIRAGADPLSCDTAGATALHLVLSNGSTTERHKETVAILLELCDVNVSDVHGRYPIHLAASQGDPTLPFIIKRTSCVDIQDCAGRTALMLAASQGHADSVQVLIENGADLDGIDSHGRTALQLASAGGHLPVVDALLTRGADEAHTDNDGAVALHYAVLHSDVGLTKALASQSTLKREDRTGQSPLLIAALHNNLNVVTELIALGANINSPAIDGTTPMRAAALAGNFAIVQVMSEHINDWEQKDLDGTPLLHSLLMNGQVAMAECVCSLSGLIDSRDMHGRAATHVICARNDIIGARMLRRMGSDFAERDSGGRTPLMTAIWAGHFAITQFLLDSVNVDPNAIDQQGASALSVTAQLGHGDLAALLLRHGAATTLRDNVGRTPIDVAKCADNIYIVNILQSASGSADSSGFGSLPNSPMQIRSPALIKQDMRFTCSPRNTLSKQRYL